MSERRRVADDDGEKDDDIDCAGVLMMLVVELASINICISYLVCTQENKQKRPVPFFRLIKIKKSYLV